MDASKVKAAILLAFLACLVSSAECDGDKMVRSAGGEGMNKSSKITVILCFARDCRSGRHWRTCYCCQTLPKFPCYWTQSDCFIYCPNSPAATPAAPAPALPGRQQQAHLGVTPASPSPEFLL
ncbi:hypothetical protein PVAP13_1KG118500 [Panicum virgatum]|uniref:Uncharacterized protein n=1 Tax=Panicum virgatum TaxID=38727 RepID=A0A8T0XAA5_PANVG|nr:hypothetical protein PVAP13_1KG118500 [Panicum virgatum]